MMNDTLAAMIDQYRDRARLKPPAPAEAQFILVSDGPIDGGS